MEGNGKDKEGKEKPGRPFKAEGVLGRGRSASVSGIKNMDDFVKRRREEQRGEEEEICKRSRTMEGSPVKEEEVKKILEN